MSFKDIYGKTLCGDMELSHILAILAITHKHFKLVSLFPFESIEST